MVCVIENQKLTQYASQNNYTIQRFLALHVFRAKLINEHKSTIIQIAKWHGGKDFAMQSERNAADDDAYVKSVESSK